MAGSKYNDASKALSRLRLQGATSEVASYWLARWTGDKAPTWERFCEKCDWRHRPAIALFEIHREKSIRCIQAGAFYRIATGLDLAGKDMLASVPAAQRLTRLERLWSVGMGAIMVEKSDMARTSAVEEIYFPLAAGRAADMRYYLQYSNWRPDGAGWISQSALATVFPQQS
jgi:hypothetical protein